MGKYYCDYCDVYLTHDSPAVRKQHNDGNRHKQSVCEYYKEFVGKKTQKDIDDILRSFEERVAVGLVVPTFGFAEAPVKVVPADGQAVGRVPDEQEARVDTGTTGGEGEEEPSGDTEANGTLEPKDEPASTEEDPKPNEFAMDTETAAPDEETGREAVEPESLEAS